MTNEDIKKRIDQNNYLIEQFISPSTFTLNNAVANLLTENRHLQDLCQHKFEDGFCIYCYKVQKEDE